MQTSSRYRFSGHETFPFRYAWLPKAVRAIRKSPTILSDDDKAMVELGVGKNMVRAIRFWATVTGVAVNSGKAGWETTEFGETLIGPEGYDPFLEDRQTLWLLHWRISTNMDAPLFAWDFLLNRWHGAEFTRSGALHEFEKEAARHDHKVSRKTLGNHLDTFLHTYVPTGGAKPSVLEDSLDCPLVELALIRRAGDRIADTAGTKREPIYHIRREDKTDISPRLFAYCVADFAFRRHPAESTVSLRELAIGQGSPGQVFKLPESAVVARLENIEYETRGSLLYEEAGIVQRLKKIRDVEMLNLLPAVYGREQVYA